MGIVKDKSSAVVLFVHDTHHSRITYIFTNKRVRYTCEHVFVGVWVRGKQGACLSLCVYLAEPDVRDTSLVTGNEQIVVKKRHEQAALCPQRALQCQRCVCV